MIHRIFENLGTILICLVLLAAVGGIVWSLIRKKKQGKSPCGCGCAGCPKGVSHRKNTG